MDFATIDAKVKNIQAQLFNLARKSNKTQAEIARMIELHAEVEPLMDEREELRFRAQEAEADARFEDLAYGPGGDE